MVCVFSFFYGIHLTILKDKRYSLDHKILLMQLISRIMGAHKLCILGFYTYIVKYVTKLFFFGPIISKTLHKIPNIPPTPHSNNLSLASPIRPFTHAPRCSDTRHPKNRERVRSSWCRTRSYRGRFKFDTRSLQTTAVVYGRRPFGRFD